MRSHRVTATMFASVCWVGLLLSAAVQAQFNYTTNNGAITITKYTGPGGDVTIPGTIDGLPVTDIEKYAFWYGANLAGVRIPGSVTNVGGHPFLGCNRLTAITVEDSNPSYSSVDGILFDKNRTTLIECPAGRVGNYAIPGIVTNIEWSAFSRCHSLTSITVNAANAKYSSLEGVLFDKGQAALVKCPAGKFGSYTIPDGVISIGPAAFQGCTGLTSVTIPRGVASIGVSAFSDCTALTSVTIPDGVSDIGQFAFGGCAGLRSVTIPGSVTSIVNAPFLDCSSLTAINVDPGNPSYSSADGVLFDKGQTKLIQCANGKAGSYAIPDGVTKIWHNAFNGCSRLTDVTIPGSVTSIGGCAFSACMTGVYFKGNAPRLDSDASLGSGMKATIYYDPGTKGWGKEFGGRPTAPWNPDAVRRTIPPPSKRPLNPGAATAQKPFSCTTNSGAITITGYTGPGGEVTIPGTIDGLPVTGIGPAAFIFGRDVTSVTIPGSVTNIASGDFTFYPGSMTEIEVDASNANYSSLDGVLFDKARTLLIRCPAGRAGSCSIPGSVTGIAEGAFLRCTGLTAIDADPASKSYSSLDGVLFDKGKTALVRCPEGKSGSCSIPGGVTSIGDGAFCRCSGLTNVTIPDGVTSIGDGAFWACSNLASVTIPEGVTNIGDSAFEHCKRLTSVTMPNSVTSIGLLAFSACSGLTNMTIPGTGTRIGEHAFARCTGLTNAYFRAYGGGMGNVPRLPRRE